MKLIEVQELLVKKKFRYWAASKPEDDFLLIAKFDSFESAKVAVEKSNAEHNLKLFVIVDELVNNVLVTREVWGE